MLQGQFLFCFTVLHTKSFSSLSEHHLGDATFVFSAWLSEVLQNSCLSVPT